MTNNGLYECKVMPFGMKNASATFQRLMNIITQGLDGCVVYIHYMIIYCDDWATHVARMRQLFKALCKAGLIINLRKSEIARTKVIYFGTRNWIW